MSVIIVFVIVLFWFCEELVVLVEISVCVKYLTYDITLSRSCYASEIL